MRNALFALSLCLAIATAGTAQASTTFSGTITGDAVWTKANSPYVTSGVAIPSGSSLTIEPGTIVKVSGTSNPFVVDGTLTIGSASTGTEPVIITSVTDDTSGGDTNNDGTTTVPTPGDWNTIIFDYGSTGNIANTSIRYGGATLPNFYTGDYFMNPLITNNGGTLTLDHTTLAQGGNDGLDQTSGVATITNSTFTHLRNIGIFAHHSTLAVSSSTFDTLTQGISVSTGASFETGNNTFAHLSSPTAISVDGSGMHFVNHGGNSGEGGITLGLSLGDDGEDLTFPKDGLPYVPRFLTVSSGFTLTILPGAIVKMNPDSSFVVDGTLNVGSSSSTDNVIITSIADDTVSGDTNGDGTTTPRAGDWRSITFDPNSTGNFANTIVRYGGSSPYNSWTGGNDWLPAIRNNGGTLTFNRTQITHNGNFGLLQLNGNTTVTNSEIDHTNQYGAWITNGLFSIHQSSIHDNGAYGLFNGSANAIDATNNYWGSPTGPTHPSNPTGTGDRVSDNVNFTPWLGVWPTPTTPPACTENCNSNVLFLPGIEASRLYGPIACDAGVCEQKLWEPSGDTLASQLKSDETGASVSPSIYTKPKDILDNAYIRVKGNVYKSFIEDMDHMVASGKINDWEGVPYDWRLPPDQILTSGKLIGGNKISYLVATSSPYIIQELKRLAASSRTGKVTIIAHSNGGLIAKRLTQLLGDDAPKLIDKIILVASPQAGTPQAITALLHGDDQGLPFDAFPYALSHQAARGLSLNMPMTYSLMPSPSYFTAVDDPVVTIDASLPEWQTKYGHIIHSSGSLRNFLTDTTRGKPEYEDLVTPEIGNAALFDQAATLHVNNLDQWTPPHGVALIQIAGWGIPTTRSGVTYAKVHKCKGYIAIPGACDLSVDEFTATPNQVVDGDGTVVVPSALWTSTTTGVQDYWVNLRDYNNAHWFITAGGKIPFKHANILEVSELRSFLTDIIASSTKPLSAYTYLSTEAPPSTDHRLRYALHSPLSLNLYDNQGRHTGISTTTGEVEEEIPGTYYDEFADVKYLFTDASSSAHIVMDGYATGTFTFHVDELQGAALIASTTWKDMPTTPATTVTLDAGSGVSTLSPMHIDLNGDGTIDLTLPPVQNGEVTLPVPKLPLTLTPDNKTMILGSILPVFTYTLSGFQNGDTATNSMGGAPLCTTYATATSSVGTYPITCTIGTLTSEKYAIITFAAGNLTILYKWSGFTQPINDTAANPSQSFSVFKGGSTIPVKFQLKNATGTPVQASTTPIFLTPQKGSIMSASVDESIYGDSASSGMTYKWDSTAQQYIYNWSTKGFMTGYWYRIYAKLEDGTTQSVVIGLR